MKINYDFPWYLQNSEGFMALYTGLYDVASNISPISLLTALDIEHTTTPEQLKLVATLYGLRGDFVAIKDLLCFLPMSLSSCSFTKEIEESYENQKQEMLKYIEKRMALDNILSSK